MIAVVTGGRNYANFERVCEVLDALKPEWVISGACRGADLLALQWAQNNEVNFIGMPAKWHLNGQDAGPRRNIEMLETAQLFAESVRQELVVLAFPGGAGTKHCTEQARSRGSEVFEIGDKKKD